LTILLQLLNEVVVDVLMEDKAFEIPFLEGHDPLGDISLAHRHYLKHLLRPYDMGVEINGDADLPIINR